MCSNAINKSLRTLDFVQDVDADIRTYTFEISFKQGAEVDFDLIKRKVEDAGFSITSFVATIHFENVPYTPGVPVTIANKSFVFTDFNGPSIDGPRNVRLLDRGFVSSKEYKKNHYPVFSNHTYNASL
jgi:copper chaperone CopZ